MLNHALLFQISIQPAIVLSFTSFIFQTADVHAEGTKPATTQLQADPAGEGDASPETTDRELNDESSDPTKSHVSEM